MRIVCLLVSKHKLTQMLEMHSREVNFYFIFSGGTCVWTPLVCGPLDCIYFPSPPTLEGLPSTTLIEDPDNTKNKQTNQAYFKT